jgi:hypothetical protein
MLKVKRKALRDLSARHYRRLLYNQTKSAEAQIKFQSTPNRPTSTISVTASTSSANIQCNDQELESGNSRPISETDNTFDSTSSSDNIGTSDCSQSYSVDHSSSGSSYESSDGNDLSDSGLPVVECEDIPIHEEQEPFNLNNRLAKWYCENNVNHSQMKSLLTILREHPCHSSLPKHPRTLLNTPRVTIVQNMPPGEYYHFGLKTGLLQTLHSVAKEQWPDVLQLLIGIDGLPLSKSSGSAFWPILCYIRTLPDSTIFPIGIFFGEGKPNDANIFITQFVEESNDLVTNGLTIGNKLLCVEVMGLICDAPAKSFVCNTKGHSGYNSCSKCTVEGEYLNNRVCFPNGTIAPMRTHESFLNQDHEEYHMGYTRLTYIPRFNLIKNVPLDPMHLICLGIMKKLIRDMWLKGKPPYKLSHRKIQEASLILVSFKNSIPSEFVRKPRALQEVARWKATELRQFLLYTGPLVLKNILSHEACLNFMTLHIAIRILTSTQYHLIYRDYAKSLLVHFVNSFKILYGVEYVSHNVHGLIHLVDDVETFGPLENFSAFRFENYMQTLKKLVRKSDKPLQQVIRRFAELKSIKKDAKMSTEGQSRLVLRGQHVNGPLHDQCKDPQYYSLNQPEFSLTLKEPNNCCGLRNGNIVIIENICYSQNKNSLVIVGRRFKKVVDLYETPCKSSLLGIHKVSNLSPVLEFWPAKHICKKYMHLACPGTTESAVFPIIHTAMHQD